MKINYYSLIKRYIPVFLIGMLISFGSCEKTVPSPTDDPEEPEESLDPENQKVNEWVTENMRIYYYWNDNIPADNQLDFGLEPPKFFEEILNDDDRFSWIQKADELNEGMQGVTTSTGMNITLFTYDEGKKVCGTIRYVIRAPRPTKQSSKEEICSPE